MKVNQEKKFIRDTFLSIGATYFYNYKQSACIFYIRLCVSYTFFALNIGVIGGDSRIPI